jgi:hypothetical protein
MVPVFEGQNLEDVVTNSGDVISFKSASILR